MMTFPRIGFVLVGILLCTFVVDLAQARKPPPCGIGFGYFSNFWKCDASLGYCFEYDNSSCVGPPNWSCVDFLNRQASVITGDNQDVPIKKAGLGNTWCCNGRFQSPIDIPADKAYCDKSLPIPRYANPDQELEGIFENNGLYPEFKIEAAYYDVPLVLKKVPFSCVVPGSPQYVLANVHLHTGTALGGRGSEHLVQGKAYDGELHLVHIRSNFVTPATETEATRIDLRCASQTPLGITVLGIFLSLTEGEPNEELDKLLSVENLLSITETEKICHFDNICSFLGNDDDDDICEDSDDSIESVKINDKKVFCACRKRTYENLDTWFAGRGEQFECWVEYKGKLIPMSSETSSSGDHDPCNQFANGPACGETSMMGVNLKPGRLLPSKKGYFHYFGSLTTPPCSEVVNWVVFKKPLRITKTQLEIIQSLESRRAGTPLGTFGSVRPATPVHRRVISTNACDA